MTYVFNKLSHGSNLLTCSQLFAIGKSIVSLIICKVVKTINIMFKSLISWPMGQNMEVIMLKCKDWWNLPSVHGAIDGIHISIPKHNIPFAKDDFYHKTSYSIVAQVVVDFKRYFIDTYVSLPWIINDFQVL